MQEIRFEQSLVRALLRDQHPDLADLDLRDVEGGWTISCGGSVESWPCACRAPRVAPTCCV
ncbi:hypothetical protein [Nocardia tengchongensis]|uniref:hypothetical protein n=1 Tax=Nocardia tengchongensis TaxID=2055889 RepID=UPI003657F77A